MEDSTIGQSYSQAGTTRLGQDRDRAALPGNYCQQDDSEDRGQTQKDNRQRKKVRLLRQKQVRPVGIRSNAVLTLVPEVVDYETDQKKEKGSQHNPQCDLKYHVVPPVQAKVLFGAGFRGGFYFFQVIEELGFCGEDQCILLG